jgi:hypothetical protein
MAMMPTTVTCFRIVESVPAVKKLLGCMSEMMPNTAMLASRMMAGMAVGLERRKPLAFCRSDSCSKSKLATFWSASASFASKSEMVLVGVSLMTLNQAPVCRFLLSLRFCFLLFRMHEGRRYRRPSHSQDGKLGLAPAELGALGCVE